MYKNKILNVLSKKHLWSIDDVHKKISDADYSTVYRNIKQLVSEGEIREIVLDKGNTMYELNHGEYNHDHFVCVDCGDIEEIHVSSKELSLKNNKKVDDVVVRGHCGCIRE